MRRVAAVPLSDLARGFNEDIFPSTLGRHGDDLGDWLVLFSIFGHEKGDCWSKSFVVVFDTMPSF